MTISDFEDNLEKAKKEHLTTLTSAVVILQANPTEAEVLSIITDLHNKGAAFFNLFERSIDEYGQGNFDLTTDTKIRKIEDAEALVDTIIMHWQTIRKIANKYNVSYPTPTDKAYSSIQRLLKKFRPNKIETIKEKFMSEQLPTNGFDSKETHSGWEIGSKKLTVAQIIVGTLLIISSAVIAFSNDTLNGFQYLFFRLTLSLGITLISTALIEINLKINWTIEKSFTVKAIGAIAFFILIYYINPPGAPTP